MKTKNRISWGAVFFNTIVAFFIAGMAGMGAAASHELPSVTQQIIQPAVFFSLFVVQFFTSPTNGVFMSGIQKQVWVKDIASNLFPDNSAINQSKDDSEYLSNKTVNLPQAGGVPSVSKNRSSLPGPISPRIDTVTTYDVDEYTTDPSVVTVTEAIEASYDKRADLLSDHLGQLQTRIFNEIVQVWSPSLAAQQVRTTGTARAALLAGQTGNRNAIKLNDLIKVQALLTNQDVPMDGGRIMLIDSNLYTDLQLIPEFQSWDKTGKNPLVDGSVGRVLDFNVFIRSSVGRYDNTGTPVIKAIGSAVAATDNLYALFWHKNFVRKAIGTDTNKGIQVFYNANQAPYYGDLFSALVRGGGKLRYTNQRGAVALIEA